MKCKLDSFLSKMYFSRAQFLWDTLGDLPRFTSAATTAGLPHKEFENDESFVVQQLKWG